MSNIVKVTWRYHPKLALDDPAKAVPSFKYQLRLLLSISMVEISNVAISIFSRDVMEDLRPKHVWLEVIV